MGSDVGNVVAPTAISDRWRNEMRFHLDRSGQEALMATSAEDASARSAHAAMSQAHRNLATAAGMAAEMLGANAPHVPDLNAIGMALRGSIPGLRSDAHEVLSGERVETLA